MKAEIRVVPVFLFVFGIAASLGVIYVSDFNPTYCLIFLTVSICLIIALFVEIVDSLF